MAKGARFGLVTAAAVIASFAVSVAMKEAAAEMQVGAVVFLSVIFGGFGTLACQE